MGVVGATAAGAAGVGGAVCAAAPCASTPDNSAAATMEVNKPSRRNIIINLMTVWV